MFACTLLSIRASIKISSYELLLIPIIKAGTCGGMVVCRRKAYVHYPTANIRANSITWLKIYFHVALTPA